MGRVVGGSRKGSSRKTRLSRVLRPDPVRGIRQFTVGTGGAPLYPVMSTAVNSEVAFSAWGVASFTLQNGGYGWAFLPADGHASRDAGAGAVTERGGIING